MSVSTISTKAKMIHCSGTYWLSARMAPTRAVGDGAGPSKADRLSMILMYTFGAKVLHDFSVRDSACGTEYLIPCLFPLLAMR